MTRGRTRKGGRKKDEEERAEGDKRRCLDCEKEEKEMSRRTNWRCRRKSIGLFGGRQEAMIRK